MKLDNFSVATWLMIAAASLSSATFAQSGSTRQAVVASTLTGGVDTFEPTRDSRAHFQGSIGLSTGDYFRGGYDNVEEDLDQIAYTTGLSATFELMRSRQGPLTDLTLTLGTANNFASSDERPEFDDDGHWYESNWYAGLAGRLGADWLGSLTYTAYDVPATDADPTHEIAVATQYAGNDVFGDLSPQFKVAAPFAADTDAAADGVFASLGLTPATQLGQRGQYPVALTFPLEVGMGFDGYYGADSGTAGYASAGIAASTPLAFMPAGYGSWSVTGAVDVLGRNDDLRATEPDFADETWVTIASVSLSLTY